MQPGAPIMHGSRMDHFYAVDAANGLTYVGHTEQTSNVTGLLNLTQYCVIPTVSIGERLRQDHSQDYGTVVTRLYFEGHSKTSAVALTGEGRIAIHNLESYYKEMSKPASAAPAAAPAQTAAIGAHH